MNDIELVEQGRVLPQGYTRGGKHLQAKVSEDTGRMKWHSKDTFAVGDWAKAPALLVQPLPSGYPMLIDKDKTFIPDTPEEVLDYILERKRVVTYSLNNEIQSIFKLFDYRLCEQLAKYSHQYIAYGSYWIKMLGNKSILVRKGNNYGWLSNFHRLQPDDFVPTIDNLQAVSQEFFSLLQHNDIELKSPSSPASIGSAYLLQRAGASFPYIPSSLIDIEHIARAYNCYKAGRMEALQIGHFEHLYNYDFTNQYASILGELQDCRIDYTTWISSKEYQRTAYYGFVKARVTIPEMWLSPMTFRLGDHNLNFPYGAMVAWIAKPELDLLIEQGCKVEILEGTWGIPRQDCKPFRQPIRSLFALRDSKFANAIKIVSVAAIGKIGSIFETVNTKTGVSQDNASPLFNPIYIAHLNSIARLKLFEAAMALGDRQELVSLTIDGVLSIKEVDIPTDRQSGELRFVGSGQGLIMTDYYKDKPLQPSRYRSMLEKAGDTDKVTMSAQVYNGISLFNRLKAIEAHNQLGKPSIMAWQVGIGSAVRHNPRITARDLLGHSYPTGVMTIRDLMVYGKTDDYVLQMLR